jgi:hypothetical protein
MIAIRTQCAIGPTKSPTSDQRLPSCWPARISAAFQTSDPAKLSAARLDRHEHDQADVTQCVDEVAGQVPESLRSRGHRGGDVAGCACSRYHV